jgi:hypothetical protein
MMRGEGVKAVLGAFSFYKGKPTILNGLSVLIALQDSCCCP